jgi:ABC-type uncharacterized transport system involved in gliding motility auxiliary subunit
MKIIKPKEFIEVIKKKSERMFPKIAAELSDKKHQWILNIIIIVLVNLLGLALYFRIDLTGNNAYSLSKISARVVSLLEEPLTVKVFFSRDLPAPYNSVSRYLADLLEEYDQAGNRHFRYEFIDVEKNRDAAADYGVQPVQVREIKNDRVSTRSAFMGLAVVHGDLIESIDSITEPEGVEYRITTLIQKMNGKIDTLLKLEKPIAVTLYASGALPISGIHGLNEKVAAVMQKANTRNYGKLEFRFVDPDKDRRALEMADLYGLPRLRWPAFTTMEGKAVGPGEGMIGIVVEHGDRFETIQLLSRTILGQFAVAGLEDLENRLNSAIDNLIAVNPKIGYTTGHGERDLADQKNGAATFRELLSDMYELRTIDLAKEDIPADIQTLIVNGPRGPFADEELLKIDQFLMKGKSALFFVDSFSEIQPDGQNMFMREPVVLPVSTGIEKLIEHYGIVINRDIVLDRNCYQTNMRGFGDQSLYFAPIIDEKGLSRDNAVTRYLKRVIFLKGSSLVFNEGARAGKSALVSSSSESWLMKGRISFMPWSMSLPPESQMARYTLAALHSGGLPSYFEGRETPAPKDKAAAQKAPVTSDSIIKKSLKPARLIVVGTSEITTPSVVDKEGKSPNAVLVHNMVDYLNGNFDIPEMRSKGLELNPLRETGEAVKLALKLFNIAGLPLLVILAGLVMLKLRMNRRKKIMHMFSKEVGNE